MMTMLPVAVVVLAVALAVLVVPLGRLAPVALIRVAFGYLLLHQLSVVVAVVLGGFGRLAVPLLLGQLAAVGSSKCRGLG